MSNQLKTECKTYLKNKGAEYKAGQWRIPHEEFECHDGKPLVRMIRLILRCWQNCKQSATYHKK